MMAKYAGQDVIQQIRGRSRERERMRERARFADLLADGASTAEAAAACGRNKTWGAQQLARMRRELGWQAR